MAVMPKTFASIWTRSLQRNVSALNRLALRSGRQAVTQALKPIAEKHRAPTQAGDWLRGVAVGLTGTRQFRLFRPTGLAFGERLPLVVMLHGCGQNANSFAMSTRMNRIASRERFLVLYPEQDRRANPQGCWNWFDSRSGRAHGEAALILNAIDQACLLYGADRTRIAVAGLSAGASMAALLATRHPERFQAVAMHSGVEPGAAHSTLSALTAMQGLQAARVPHPSSAEGVQRPPLLVIHGASDRVVANSNAHASAQAWADFGGAVEHGAREAQRGRRYATKTTEFKRGRKTVVTLVEVDRLGHAWSGGMSEKPFSDHQGPDASRMIWTFATKQFRA